MLQDLDCCYSTTYKNQRTFRFLPGHRSMILNFPKLVKSMQQSIIQQQTINSIATQKEVSSNEFSHLLKMFNETAEQNANRVPTRYRYSETIRYFAIYIFIMCGRMSYEILSANLPLPQASTVCKQFQNFFTNVLIFISYFF